MGSQCMLCSSCLSLEKLIVVNVLQAVKYIKVIEKLIKMKLLTHNMLTSKSMKAVTTGYPLQIQARDVKVMEVDFKPEFVARIIPKIDWECLCRAAEELGHLNDLPKMVPDNYENDEEFLKKAHHVMLEVEVINGDLICPESSRKFPVTDGIPNMLLNEDEI